MPKKILLFIVGFIVCALAIAGSLFFMKISQFKAMGAHGAAMVMPPTTVTAAPAKQETWGDSLTAPGSLEAVQGVTVAAEVAGKVVKYELRDRFKD